ncbi:MAG TPA: hypothetical protein VHL79_17590 [Ramlibacter sp.]|jgi:hypothetical protein|nr:hypothetical protein [Ramlibacter sp.]
MALFVATPARRRAVMIALLVLAASGAVIRTMAPEPSTLRDVGTLMLVLWLPVIGNLVAWLLRKIKVKAPPSREFPTGIAFVEDLQVHAQVLALPPGLLASVNAQDRRCTVLLGQQGFTARLPQPAAQVFATPGERTLSLQFLRPEVALKALKPGTAVHVLVGTTAAATGRVG